MAAATVVAADTDAEARRLFSSLQQSFVSLRTGMPGPLPPPVDDFESRLDPQAKYMLAQALSCAVIGGPATVKAGLAAFIARTGADEVMVTASIFDHAARLRSFEIVMAAHEGLALAA
jgi:alkanesulfonate monooxygenase SsuD/methylene tetrahydromethanopterin reductase-like flavin-dependent oxidoreductase (luciferase family)